MKLTEKQFLILKRKRGENNLTINELANETDLSRFTVSKILKNGLNEDITPTTFKKLNDWLINKCNHNLREEAE